MFVWAFLTWNSVEGFLNTNFTSSLLAAAAGAVGGALAAQRIADRTKIRDDLRREVAQTYGAIALCAGIVGDYFNLKEQFVRDLYQRYTAQRTTAFAYIKGLNDGTIPPGTPLDVSIADLRRHEPVSVPIARLERYLIDDLSVSARPRMLVLKLAQSVEGLNTSFSKRNAMVETLIASSEPLAVKARFLFSLPQTDRIDEQFASNVDALYRQTDDCIQFGLMLYADLFRHGARKRGQYVRRFGNDIPRVQQASFDGPEAKGLLPPAEDYQTWVSNFVSRVPPSTGRKLGRDWYLKRRLFRRTLVSKAMGWLWRHRIRLGD